MAVECVVGSHVAPEERFDFFWRQQGEWVEEPNVAGVVKVAITDCP